MAASDLVFPAEELGPEFTGGGGNLFDSIFGAALGGGLGIPGASASSSARSRAAGSQEAIFSAAFNVNSGANSVERIVQMALPFVVVAGVAWLAFR